LAKGFVAIHFGNPAVQFLPLGVTQRQRIQPFT